MLRSLKQVPGSTGAIVVTTPTSANVQPLYAALPFTAFQASTTYTCGDGVNVLSCTTGHSKKGLLGLLGLLGLIPLFLLLLLCCLCCLRRKRRGQPVAFSVAASPPIPAPVPLGPIPGPCSVIGGGIGPGFGPGMMGPGAGPMGPCGYP